MTSPDSNHSTPLDLMARDIPEEAIGPKPTEDEAKQKRLDLMHRAIKRLGEIDENLRMIERAIGANMPDVLRDLPLGDACDMVSDFKLVMDQLGGDSGTIAGIKSRLSYLREVTMPEILTAAKVKTFNTDRFRVSKTTKLMASVNPEAGVHTEGEFAGQPKSWDWLRENGYGMLIKPTVNASSLSSTAKELIESGHELPEDLFRVHTKESISITKKKG